MLIRLLILLLYLLRVDRQQFEETIRKRTPVRRGGEAGRPVLPGGFAWPASLPIPFFLCIETHYEKVLKKIAKYIQEQIEKIYAPQGLLITDPIERGLRVVSFLNVYSMIATNSLWTNHQVEP
ncbi:unnamed protein product [Ranitomeya imitator]|uniref:Uncharacterized protein n=1 Tax=Ranitomeya imitator TaxID=111125 RepID=A0ABN9KY98_9NEOB|nr:unnamed protein product [Ranitomeya imitator]